eukprot:Skav225007  [mRNA]  locus=scaffold957:135772:139480:+ [translate_table: standard]
MGLTTFISKMHSKYIRGKATSGSRVGYRTGHLHPWKVSPLARNWLVVKVSWDAAQAAKPALPRVKNTPWQTMTSGGPLAQMKRGKPMKIPQSWTRCQGFCLPRCIEDLRLEHLQVMAQRLGFIDLKEGELKRLYDSIDSNADGIVTFFEFAKAVADGCGLDNGFVTKTDYDYSKPTFENYRQELDGRRKDATGGVKIW